jgi:AcrR family transcriptional regulator
MPKVVPGYKAQARERILVAAHEVFHRSGFRGTTMDDIAREVGVSKGALYLYFPTKNDLLGAMQRQFRRQILEKWERLLDRGDIAEGIASSLDELFRGDVAPDIYYEMSAAAAADPGLRRILADDYRQDRKVMEQFLRRLQQRGRIPKGRDAATLAEVILMLIRGMFLQLMMKGTLLDARKQLVRSLRFVLDG